MCNRRQIFGLLLLVITYLNHIKPILDAHCIECHSPGNFLDLSWYPFHSQNLSEQSAIVERMILRVQPGVGQMPPGHRPKLTTDEIETIQQWLQSGLNI
ncbi:MAG: hypothetical protein ACKOA8_06035 [Deltaproteobacteria bacterium]